RSDTCCICRERHACRLRGLAARALSCPRSGLALRDSCRSYTAGTQAGRDAPASKTSPHLKCVSPGRRLRIARRGLAPFERSGWSRLCRDDGLFDARMSAWLAGASGYSRARVLVEACGALETPSSRRLPADQRLISPGPGRLRLRPGRPSAPCRRPRAPVPAGAVHRRPLAAAGMEWMGGMSRAVAAIAQPEQANPGTPTPAKAGVGRLQPVSPALHRHRPRPVDHAGLAGLA